MHAFREGLDILRQVLKVFCREMPFTLEYAPIEPERGIILDDKALTVETVPLSHRVPAVGFVFREKPGLRHLRGDMVKFLDIPVSQLGAIKAGAPFVTADGTVYDNERLTTPPSPAMSYGYCSDTAFKESIAECFAGVDTLYHEATYCEDNAFKAAPRGHSTAAQAGMAATIAGARRLVVGHYSKSYNDDAQFAREAATTFSGEVVAAHEGLHLDLP